jgi:hypothetical protein
MRSTTSASPRDLPDTTSTGNDRKGTTTAPTVSLPRLYVGKQGDRWRSDATRAGSDRA